MSNLPHCPDCSLKAGDFVPVPEVCRQCFLCRAHCEEQGWCENFIVATMGMYENEQERCGMKQAADDFAAFHGGDAPQAWYDNEARRRRSK